MQYFRVTDFTKFLYLRHHQPPLPWVKLRSRMVDRKKFIALSDVSKAHLMLLWLEASKCDNRLPYNPEWIKYALKVTEDVDLDILVQHGFIEIIKS